MFDKMKVEECKRKLLIQSRFDSNKALLKLVYMWIKQNHITYKEFEALMGFVNTNPEFKTEEEDENKGY